jgi:sarcosine oxidase / L-pipecolate oxidase
MGYSYKMYDGEQGGFYAFPRDDQGVVKVGYRGLKYTNPQTQADGRVRSVPVTRWTPISTRQVPLAAAQRIKSILKQFIPDLLPYHTKTRLCWYTDTYDNHFVIDYVPDKSRLLVVTGGSGHGFKFLPTIGRYVVDRIEGNRAPELKMWRWRRRGDDEVPYNRIMEGLSSRLALVNQALAVEDSLDGEVARL